MTVCTNFSNFEGNLASRNKTTISILLVYIILYTYSIPIVYIIVYTYSIYYTNTNSYPYICYLKILLDKSVINVIIYIR